jgi:hypothetical protein
MALVFWLNLTIDGQTVEQTVKIEPPPPGGSLYRYVPFEVPQGTESLSVSFDFDRQGGANSLNFGIFETGFSGRDSDKNGLRGWSGYVREAVFIARDRATHGYRPGAISAGKWFVIVGLAKVAPAGVDLKLKISFNRIDEKPLKQFETEKNKKFTHDDFPKSRPLKTANLIWFRGDLHSHSVHGDGSWSVKGILDSAASNGLDFVAVTEHNTYTHHREIDTEKKNYPTMLIIRGEEVTTYGAHINVWGLPSGKWIDFRVLPGLAASGRQIADEAHGFGALASINHPTMGCGGCSWTYGDDWGIMDSVEVWNATWDPDDEKALKLWDEYLQRGKSITAVASSDSHQPPSEPSAYPVNLRIGEPAVFIGAKSLSEKSLFGAIKAGRVWAAANPRYEVYLTAGNKTIGDRITATKNQKVEVKIRLNGFVAGATARLISDGKIIRENAWTGANLTETFAFASEKNGYLRLEVRDPNGNMLAFTNPIYFNVKP